MTRELKLKERMIAYENGSPARIQHFMKVYAFADIRILTYHSLISSDNHNAHTLPPFLMFFAQLCEAL